MFDHEKLQAYRSAIAFAAWVQPHLRSARVDADLKKQLSRAAHSVALNIAEGNGRTLPADRCRFVEIARGSALECAACLDLFVATDGMSAQDATTGKEMLALVVSLLTGSLRSLGDRIHETEAAYGTGGTAGCSHDGEQEERRKTEQEQEHEREQENEQEHEHEQENERRTAPRLLVRRKEGCEDIPLPRYMSAGASGMDLHAAVEKETAIAPGQVALIPTGLHIAVPAGFEAQVRPRSGLALKHRVAVLNSPGTVDSDYRNEVCVVLANLGDEPFVVTRGMRVAQMVICRTWRAEVVEVDELDETERNLGGFGSTGLH